MKQTSSINVDSNIQKAQDAVEVNLARFESALAHLADRVEQTSHRVEHVGELARRSKDELLHLKETAQGAIEPLMPIIQQGRDASTRAVGRVKENPKSFLWAFAGVIGAYLAYRSFSSRQVSQSSNRYVPTQRQGFSDTYTAGTVATNPNF